MDKAWESFRNFALNFGFENPRHWSVRAENRIGGGNGNWVGISSSETVYNSSIKVHKLNRIKHRQCATYILGSGASPWQAECDQSPPADYCIDYCHQTNNIINYKYIPLNIIYKNAGSLLKNGKNAVVCHTGRALSTCHFLETVLGHPHPLGTRATRTQMPTVVDSTSIPKYHHGHFLHENRPISSLSALISG